MKVIVELRLKNLVYNAIQNTKQQLIKQQKTRLFITFVSAAKKILCKKKYFSFPIKD